ncbi:MAG: hypothetical protein AAF202_12200, partial [Pseudomonadota bacterium]
DNELMKTFSKLFKGKLNLKDHDAIHILLGAGLLPKDEALVIGWSMGAAGVHDWVMELFLEFTQNVYPHPWNFNAEEHEVFRIAFHSAKETGFRDVGDRELFEELEVMMDRKLADIRAHLFVDVGELMLMYRDLAEVFPNSYAAYRWSNNSIDHPYNVTPPPLIGDDGQVVRDNGEIVTRWERFRKEFVLDETEDHGLPDECHRLCGRE